tara:strand:+ start:195 stop:440 length:246 start_codon:yes stop_codon:yes gene_type:complete
VQAYEQIAQTYGTAQGYARSYKKKGGTLFVSGTSLIEAKVAAVLSSKCHLRSARPRCALKKSAQDGRPQWGHLFRLPANPA